MKITTTVLLFFGVFVSSFVKAQIYQNFCGTDEIHEWLMQTNPQYRSEFLVRESQIQVKIAELSTQRRSSVIYTIPIVVHVIHLGEPIGTSTNISDQDIIDAISGLNDRFRNVIGNSIDVEIEFCLAKRDPNGNPSTGINRVDGSSIPDYTNYGIQVGGCGIGATESLVKDLSNWPVSEYYNIWVVNTLCDGQWGGWAWRDGATVEYYSMWYNSSLLTHELGHGFGLWHTFDGDNNDTSCPIDTNCALNGDEVCDTPPHKQNDCDMTNPCTNQGVWDNSRYNYMSYCDEDDRFTQNQKERMIAAVNSYHSGLINSLRCVPSTCAVACSDGDPCTTDICDSGNCITQAIVCDDNNICTDDSCIGGICMAFNNSVSCSDGDACTDDICIDGICVSLPKNCSDSNFCTTDLCINGVCTYTPTFCDDNDECTMDECLNGDCNYLCTSSLQPGSIKWQRSLGGSGTDQAYSVVETDDGGYIIAGRSNSNNGLVEENNGNSDIWVVKLDKAANIEWQQSYGGISAEQINSIQPTNDGGYIIAGSSFSNNGDVTGNHGNYDFWIVKLDSLGGLLWQKALGGTKRELAYSIQQTIDGGYVVAGSTSSNDGDVTGFHGGVDDYWVVKLNFSGDLVWQKTCGGSLTDVAYAIRQTSDDGYVVAGYSNSTEGDISGNKGGYDYWVLKLDSVGNIIWKKNLGGIADDYAYSMQVLNDKSCILSGFTTSDNGDVTGFHGNSDYWVVKLDSSGNLLWQKALGGSASDVSYSIEPTQDGGYITAGSSRSTNGDVLGNHGSDDFWIVKLSTAGTVEWKKAVGGSNPETAFSIIQTSDGCFVVIGHSNSANGDLLINYGGSDYWIVKLNGTATGCCDDNILCTFDSCENGSCVNSDTCGVYISGLIHTATNTPIAGVKVILNGSQNDTVVTSANGAYNFVTTPNSNCIITSSKTNDSLPTNGITTLDIVFIQKQILAIQPLPLNTPYLQIAADVNGSESVTTLDIVFIRSVILNISSAFPGGKMWAFVPDDHLFGNPQHPFPFPNSRAYNNLNSSLPDQNFIGIKLGDVNNSWIPKTGAVDDVQFVMNEYSVLPEVEIIIPISVKDFKNVIGYQYTLSWDASVLSLLEVNNKALSGYYGEQKKGEGYLTTSWNDDMTKAVTLDDNAVAFELKFKVIGAIGTQSAIKISSEITVSEAYNDNLDLLDIVPTNGMVKVGDGSSVVNQQSSIYNLSVVPNPFSNTTNIIFAIPKEETVNIEIYDLIGKKIKKIEGRYKAGEHIIQWKGDDEYGNSLSKGLYHIRMLAGEYTKGQKVILLK